MYPIALANTNNNENAQISNPTIWPYNNNASQNNHQYANSEASDTTDIAFGGSKVKLEDTENGVVLEEKKPVPTHWDALPHHQMKNNNSTSTDAGDNTSSSSWSWSAVLTYCLPIRKYLAKLALIIFCILIIYSAYMYLRCDSS